MNPNNVDRSKRKFRAKGLRTSFSETGYNLKRAYCGSKNAATLLTTFSVGICFLRVRANLLHVSLLTSERDSKVRVKVSEHKSDGIFSFRHFRYVFPRRFALYAFFSFIFESNTISFTKRISISFLDQISNLF